MRNTSVQLLLLSMIIAISILMSCSDNNPANSDAVGNVNYLQNVTFVPDSGPPGTPVEITNLSNLPDDGFWSIQIGDQLMPLIENDSNYITIIPLLFSTSDSTWPIASATPLDVVLYLDSSAVDTAFGMITVDSLPHADGAADSLIQDLLHGANAIRQITLSLNIQDTLLQGVCLAMDEMLVTGENSLTAIINGTSPIAEGEALPRDLFSALLVSTGMSDAVSTWSDGLQEIEQSAAKYPTNGLSTAAVDDEGLAYRMQMYSLLEGFSSQVINQTALEWNKYSAVLGCAGVAFPPLGFIEFIVSFVVAELDFIFNKLALALLPARITSFDLNFAEHEIKPGDTTAAIVYISARNNPPNITPLDIVTQVINGMALADWISNLGEARRFLPQNFEEIVQGLTTWFLGVINNALGTHFNAPTMLDVSLPVITYDSVLVQNPDLIDLISPALSKIEPITGSINGLAKDSIGKAPLMIATQTGPNTLIHPVLAAAGYVGGAFGYDYRTSNTDTVTVVPTLVLKADFADTLSTGGAGALEIYAGYLTSTNDTNWSAGIDLNLYVSGGHLESSSGTTDTQGYFGTIAHHDSLSSEIEIRIYAEGAEGSVADTTITAFVLNLILEASFPDSLYYQSSGQLQVRGGYVQPGGSIDWCDGLTVSLNVTGGTPDIGIGTTDLSGNFQTMVTSNDPTTPMTIAVDLYGTGNTHVDTIIYVTIDTTASNGNHSMQVTGSTYRISGSADASYGSDVNQSSELDDFREIASHSSNISGNESVSKEFEIYTADGPYEVVIIGSAGFSASAGYSISIDPVTGDLLSLSYSGSSNANASKSTTYDSYYCSASASADADLHLYFTISEGTYLFTASGSVSYNGSQSAAAYVGPTGTIVRSGSVNESVVLTPGSYILSIDGMSSYDTYNNRTDGGSGNASVSLYVSMSRVTK